MPEMHGRLFLVLVVLVLVIEKIEFVKHDAKRIEDENECEEDDDIPAVYSTSSPETPGPDLTLN